jgi:hypothetical protein
MTMNDSTDINETAELDPRDAAVIMAEAGARARRQLTISHPVIFASWSARRSGRTGPCSSWAAG